MLPTTTSSVVSMARKKQMPPLSLLKLPTAPTLLIMKAPSPLASKSTMAPGLITMLTGAAMPFLPLAKFIILT